MSLERGDGQNEPRERAGEVSSLPLTGTAFYIPPRALPEDGPQNGRIVEKTHAPAAVFPSRRAGPLSTPSDESRGEKTRVGNGKPGRSRKIIDATKRWLVPLAREGVSVERLKQQAALDGYAWRTVTRAKAELGIVSRKAARFGGGWGWVATGGR